MKKMIFVALASAMTLSLAACGSNSTTTQTEAAAETEAATETEAIDRSTYCAEGVELDEKGQEALESLYTTWVSDTDYNGTVENAPEITLSAEDTVIDGKDYTLEIEYYCFDDAGLEMMFIAHPDNEEDPVYNFDVFENPGYVDQYSLIVTEDAIGSLMYCTEAEIAARAEAETETEASSASTGDSDTDWGEVAFYTDQFMVSIYIADPDEGEDAWASTMSSFNYDAITNLEGALEFAGDETLQEAAVKEGFDSGIEYIEGEYGYADPERLYKNLNTYYSLWSEKDAWADFGENAELFIQYLNNYIEDME